MFDDSFRARFAGWVKPLAPALARLGVTANHVTIISFVLTLVAAALIADGRSLAGLAIWILSRIGDGLDGVLAR
ncbi:MAG: CDP-alcohol phosphatidyltransferase family protein, partial [Vicinamibacterales bacterium]